MGKVCIITPGPLVSTPRVVKEATALAEAGHIVSVICGHSLPWVVKADAELAAGAKWSIAAAVPFGKQLASLPRYVIQTVRRRSALILWKIGLRHVAIAEFAQSPHGYDLSTKAVQIPADLYIAHYVAGLPAAALAAKRNNARYSFDGEDYHPGDPPPGPEHDIERSLINTILGTYLPHASAITVAAPLMAKAYKDNFAVRNPQVVLNVFPLSPHRPKVSSSGSAAPGPSVYWVSQTIGEDRGLEEVIQACGISSVKPHLYLRGYVSKSYRSHLEELASLSGVIGHVHFLEWEPPDRLENLASVYDAGLCSETGQTQNHDIALANKIFSYLVAGIPVIMSDTSAHRLIGSDLGSACRLYKRNDPVSLAQVFDGLFAKSDELAKARAAAYAAASLKYNWEVEKWRLVELLTPIATTRPMNLSSEEGPSRRI